MISRSNYRDMEDPTSTLKRKRTESALPTPITPMTPIFSKGQEHPWQVMSVCADGDAIVVISGLDGRAKPVGLRISTQALSISSPVFKRLLAEVQPLPPNDPVETPTKVLTLTDDPGSALLALINVLHLRNEALPTRMTPIELSRFVEVAAKYSCIQAACRAASPWFDHIFTRHPNPPLYQMVKAALVCGDAVYFARFSSRWVLHEPLTQQLNPTIPTHPPNLPLTKALLQRQKDAIRALRVDIDDLVNPLADALSREFTHYVDSPPGDNPVPVDLGGDEDPQVCESDKEGAIEYLGALRDAKIWPTNQWPWTNLLGVTEAVEKLHIPEYDISQSCHFCADIVTEFKDALDAVKLEHKDRLWGLCLDCYKAGRVKEEDCTFEHHKSTDNLVMRQMGDASGK